MFLNLICFRFRCLCINLGLLILLVCDHSVGRNIQRLLDDHVLDRLEFGIVHQRNPFWQFFCVSSYNFFSLLIPQVIERSDPLVGGKVRYNSVHDSLNVCFQIPILLFPARF